MNINTASLRRPLRWVATVISASMLIAVGTALCGMSPLWSILGDLSKMSVRGEDTMNVYAWCSGKRAGSQSRDSLIAMSECVWNGTMMNGHPSDIDYMLSLSLVTAAQCYPEEGGKTTPLPKLDKMASEISASNASSSEKRSAAVAFDKALSCGGNLPHGVCAVLSPFEFAVVSKLKDVSLEMEATTRKRIDEMVSRTVFPEKNCAYVDEVRKYAASDKKGDLPKDPFVN